MYCNFSNIMYSIDGETCMFLPTISHVNLFLYELQQIPILFNGLVSNYTKLSSNKALYYFSFDFIFVLLFFSLTFLLIVYNMLHTYTIIVEHTVFTQFFNLLILKFFFNFSFLLFIFLLLFPSLLLFETFFLFYFLNFLNFFFDKIFDIIKLL